VSGCALDMTFPLGVNNFLPITVQVQNNNMSQANVDATLQNLYNAEVAGKYATTIAAKSLYIGGTNAAPSGIYADVTTPVTGNEYKWKLVNTYNWTISSN